jgi:hypothetical protein
MAGYSPTPLERKLGVKPGLRIAVIAGPPDFQLDGVRVYRRLVERLDLILLFARSSAELRRRLPGAVAALVADGSLWVAWPKRSSGVPTDVGENLLRELILPLGLVDNKVCAIDETWSGLRFVVRVGLRDGWGAAT